jgi:hypothetical protein
MRLLRMASPIVCVAALACGDSVAPTVDDVAGSYIATTFTTDLLGSTTDQLAQGSLLNMVLTADGQTTGHLFVPGAGDQGGDFDADLTGRWTLHGDTVEFDQTADTFVRDMPFVFSDGKLSGAAVFTETRVQVVLERQ